MFLKKWLFCLGILIYTSVSFSQNLPVVYDLDITDCTIGKPACRIQAIIQKWKLVDCTDSTMWIRTLQGEIVSNNLNTGKKGKRANKRCKIHDGDWNIYIRPYPEYEYLGYNSKGELNKRKNEILAGCVKAEIKLEHPLSSIKNGLDLKTLFPPGSQVEVGGWWVQDHGHKPRHPSTELHPFIYLKTLTDYATADSFVFFIADDRSHRFKVSGHDISYSFQIPIETECKAATIDSSGTMEFISPIAYLEEEFIIDQFTNDSVLFATSQVEVTQTPDAVSYNVYLSGNASSPIYCGLFRRGHLSEFPLFYLKEKIIPIIEYVDSLPVYKYVITMDLISDNMQGRLTDDQNITSGVIYSKWMKKTNGDEDTTTTIIIGNHDQHTFTDTLVYAPFPGWEQTEITIHVMGSTLPENFIPAVKTYDDGISYGGSYKRIMVQARRKFLLQLNNPSDTCTE